MLINSIGCISLICQNNNTISNNKLKSMTNNNVSFGFWYDSKGARSESLERGAKFLEDLSKWIYKETLKERRVPKDGIWGVVNSKLNNMISDGKINSETLTDYKIRIVNIKVLYEGEKCPRLEKVLRRTFSQNNGQITYSQDLYKNGKVETNIIKRTPSGKVISHDNWVEMVS